MSTYGMCLYNITKLHEEQGQEFLILPDSEELRNAIDVLDEAVKKARNKLESNKFNHFIQTQADKLHKGIPLKTILEETANYYKKD